MQLVDGDKGIGNPNASGEEVGRLVVTDEGDDERLEENGRRSEWEEDGMKTTATHRSL